MAHHAGSKSSEFHEAKTSDEYSDEHLSSVSADASIYKDKSKQPRHDRRTYRVRKLPSSVDMIGVARLLARFEGFGNEDNVHVHSLAPDLSPWQRTPNKVATVTFKETPKAFGDGSDEWVLDGRQVGLQTTILVDTKFLDFTPLNDIHDAYCEVECIAISGLGSHPFGSWNSSTGFMWLRDGLPNEISGVRSILYGYDTALQASESFQTVEDIATTFIVRLRSIKAKVSPGKPIIILAHSFGGIIVQSALVQMAREDFDWRDVLPLIKAVILFGVPNQGMEISSLSALVDGQPNQQLVDTLARESPYLMDLREDFRNEELLRAIRIVSAHETRRSQLVQKTEAGAWARCGKYERLVERASAIHAQTRSTDILPIDEDHSKMVKFRDGDSNYHNVLAMIGDIKANSI